VDRPIRLRFYRSFESVLVWGGEQAVARQVATGEPRDDARFAREAAYSQWFGLYRRGQASGAAAGQLGKVCPPASRLASEARPHG
jgi:hypothetical protein